MYTRINHPENLEVAYEYDSGYELLELDELDKLAGQRKIAICGESTGALDDCSYVYVDSDYEGDLSMAQRELYELLLTFQTASLYTVTTVGKLAQELGLKNPYACIQRFENLQSLGAISGLKWH
ncbi:MAG: hypothetical protein ACFB0C_24295 [Leptolyngbyaceae cyanobacterium]